MLIIPTSDLIFGHTIKIEDYIKGEVVLSILDDSFATTESLIVRNKNDHLVGYYSFSVAVFGAIEVGKVKINNDSILTFESNSRDIKHVFKFNPVNGVFTKDSSNIRYKCFKNKLLKQTF